MKHFCLGVVLGVCATSCGISYEMSRSSVVQVTPKSGQCEFQVVSMPPSMNEYEEIAILTPTSSRWADSPQSFKDSVGDDVCRVGGDVVVTEVNGIGRYVRGTVLRKRGPVSTAQ